jgi:methyltransferase (TIGR00027 family)
MKNSESSPSAPDSTAVRVALWRALHVEVDPPPHLLKDDIGLRLIAPEEGWRQRPDMHPQGTRGYRLSIVTRARFIEDLVQEQASKGVDQYVILGAGLDTFAQRRPDLLSRLKIFEIDQPGTQEWKKRRLTELGFGIPDHLKFVPVDFEANDSWKLKLADAGFDFRRPAVLACAGVTMYLTEASILAMLREVSSLARGSTLVMTFILPLDLIDAEERPQHQMVYERAREAGTPFLSFLSPSDALTLAREAGFSRAEAISKKDLIQRYFADRSDGLQLASGEEILVATV